jgi:hypothetical protein
MRCVMKLIARLLAFLGLTQRRLPPMTTGNAAVNPKMQFFDSAGDPLAGGKLYTYSAGTTNALATYTTSALTVANANPVILDANGEADVWLTPGVNYKFVLKTSADVVRWTVDNIPSATSPDTTFDVATDPGGRLTVASGTPVTTSDTNSTTIYYAPHRHCRIPIYNGSEWVLETFAELSQTTTDTTKSPAAVANNTNYDLFVWNDSGTIRLSRGPAWTTATARGTGAGTTQITQLNGRYVNAVSIANGPAANRGTYVGTVRSDGSAQINDSSAKRNVWNNYWRVARPLRVVDTTDTWTYSTNTLRQANGSATNQVDVVIGLSEDEVSARVDAWASNSTITFNAAVGVGLDSTSAYATGFVGLPSTMPTAAVSFWVGGSWRGYPGLGYHYLAWLERGSGNGTTTWSGDGGAPTSAQSGLSGTCWA